MTPSQDDLSIEELIRLADETKVLKIFAERKCRSVTIDYVPARPAMAFPRAPDDIDGLEAVPPHVIPVHYRLEDTMFGGSVYVAMVVGHRVVIKPFVWVNYEELASYDIVVN